MELEQRISAIETQKNDPKRRSIFINGKFALGVDESVAASLRLQVGQAISEEDLRRIVHSEQVEKAKERALRLLDYRARSRTEVAQRLRRAGFADEVVEETLERLEALGLIDDSQFAGMWVNHRLAGKAMGKTRIKWELRQKGIQKETVEEALAAVDADQQYESAMRLAVSRWDKDSPDERAQRRRLASYLRRRGFDWDTINRVLDELASEDEP